MLNEFSYQLNEVIRMENSVSIPTVEIDTEAVLIHDLRVEDERTYEIVKRTSPLEAASTVIAMIRVGAEGLGAMGDFQQLDFVREQVSGLLAKTEHAIDRLADQLVAKADDKFDPAKPGSYSQQIGAEVDRARREVMDALAKATTQIREDEGRLRKDLEGALSPQAPESAARLALDAFAKMIDGVQRDFDPGNKDGHLGRLVQELDGYSASGGPFEIRLKDELRVFKGQLTEELRTLRDLVVREQALRTSKPSILGDEFEAAVEAALSAIARHTDGDWIEDVTKEVGEVTDARAGDFNYHLAEGHVVAVEARNRSGVVTLGGRTGVVEGLKRTKDNRKADFAIYCVASDESLPDQVGYMQRYGDDRIVCCFGTQGEILALAIKFARLCLVQRSAACSGVDEEQLRTVLGEIQRKVATLATVKRWCTNISESADKIRAHVGSVAAEASELTERALAELSAGKDVEQ
jgi:hypothetical protein